MKVAFVIHHVHKWGGQERSTLELINRCSKKHEVSVYAHTLEGAVPNVKFHKIPLIINKPFFVKDFIFRLLVTIKLFGNKFDVINTTGNCCFHSNVITIQFIQKRWALERNKLKKTWRWYWAWFQSKYDVFWEFIIYNFLRDKWYVAISSTVATDLKETYNLKKIKTIPHGVNLEEFAPSENVRLEMREKLKVSPDETLLLFVGTFERKGLFFLLPVVAKLARRFKLKLLVVGTGPKERALALLDSLGIRDLVMFAGHQQIVAPYYQASDLFVFPSLYDPFGLVGIEALATGLPSIISVQCGVSDFIKPGVNGWLIEDPTSEEELEKALTHALEDKVSFSELKARVRDSVLNASWDVVWAQYEEVFLMAAQEPK